MLVQQRPEVKFEAVCIQAWAVSKKSAMTLKEIELNEELRTGGKPICIVFPHDMCRASFILCRVPRS